MIPYGRQDVSEDDVRSVVEVLKSDYLTQGPIVPAFEMKVAAYCGVQYGVAVNSATSALHIACMALGVSKNDEVWTSPITFVASANCAIYCGANIDFVDIDPKTYNLSVTALEKKLEKAKSENKLPKVVIPVHLAGQSCEMEKIHLLSQKYGFKIIEDASHAIGGEYKNKKIGNCLYSDITVFSFHPVKIITTGEGGMCLTNDSKIALKLTHLRSHGITRNPAEMTKLIDGPWYYQQIDLGFNYRMTDIGAALGLNQMKRLDEFVNRRKSIAAFYDEALSKIPSIITPYQNPDTNSSYHLYIIRIKSGYKGGTHLQIFEKLRSAGILVNLHYIPVYKHPFYQNLGHSKDYFPESEAYYSEAISIPIYPQLTNNELEFIVEQISKPMGHQNLF